MLPSGVHTTNCMRRSTSCTACAPHTCTCRCRMQMPAPESRCYTHTHTHTHRTVIPRLHYTTGCQTACTTALTTVFNKQPLFVQPVVKPGCTTVLTTGLTTGCIHDTAGCQTGCQTGLTTGWMFVYTIQPVVKPVWQPLWQQVVSCKRGFTFPVIPLTLGFDVSDDRKRVMQDRNRYVTSSRSTSRTQVNSKMFFSYDIRIIYDKFMYNA